MDCRNIEKCAYDIEHRKSCKLNQDCFYKQQDSDEKLTEEQLLNLAEFFSVFADSTRISILHSLIGGERCVCDIAEKIEVSQSAVSHQLKILKQSKLVRYRRSGKSIIYSLADEHVSSIMALGIIHLCEK
ncbi:MAG: hypothetical protein A2Y17_03485 [Clostridiales bacterium GWF2_38_85]|nr:MAG: hypothetical protein A2Y17_03485 [Clostridiales bacterium GWF2_38_85]HBL85270.1 transcriptional regulator [Clostridiales bacterium]